MLNKEDNPLKYIYIKACCCKQLNKLKEAEEFYKQIYKKVSPEDFTLLSHLMILMAFKYKNKIGKYIDFEIKISSRT